MHSPSISGDLSWRKRSSCAVALLLVHLAAWAASPDWKPAAGPLMTKWARDVKPSNVLPEYPRPQMARKDWQNLNGLWDYAITDQEASAPTQWTGKILVPFPIQSALSGVMTNVNENQRLWYARKFTVPRGWQGRRLLLNFGAVDWDTAVWVNGRDIGKHQGGYDGFSFDITDALQAKGENEIKVSVWDPSDGGPQPRGKQVRKPGGIWYTPSSGIWQTVWLEPLETNHVKRLKITPDVEAGSVRVLVDATATDYKLRISVLDGRKEVAVSEIGSDISKPIALGHTETLLIPKAKLWSPESSFLYGLKVTLTRGGKVADEIESYFAMRKISMARDGQGRLRMQLNNTNYFQLGPLDQGFWPDGLYTAPTDEALRYDIEMTKKLGFNMARKHVKVEPERWYYWCDKLGLLVWQDMPSGDKSAHWRGPSGYEGEEMKRTPESVAIYEKELRTLIDGRYNHPCIVVWVPFNEGWGQFDTVRILNLAKELDPTRLIDGASGGNHFPAGDILDHHQYPGPGAPVAVTDRAMVLGEFGGLGLPLKGHTWQSEKNWGYRSFTNSEALTKNYVSLLRKLQPMIEDKGLSAAIYTQTTDVEVEINGLMTYDRAVVKMPVETVAKANRFDFPPQPVQRVLSPTAAQHVGVTWRYTTEKPGEEWFKTSFDAATWSEGRAGFGIAGTPGSIIGTEWKSGDIWLRREFEVSEIPPDLRILMAHDEDAEVYLNGLPATKAQGHIGDYQEFEVSVDAAKSVHPGRNVLAVHCHQTTGGQYIDVGIVALIPAPARAAAAAADPGGVSAQSQSAASFVGQVASGTGSVPPRSGAGSRPVAPVARDGLYGQNRAPLIPAPFMKLPIGAIAPKGWLRHQLELEAKGLTGRLPEISPWLNYEKSSWSSATGEGNFGWEEMPYWLKGYGDLAYILQDERLLSETRKWIEAILRTQRDDGYFGPRSLLTSLKGQPDLWPHMLVLNILQSWREYSGDERVIPFMMKYHRWLNERPPAQFAYGYWPTIRFGDNIETCHWLYNRTGEPFLLELARRIHENMAAWRDDVINWHNVNIAQGFRAPGVFFTQSGNVQDLERAELNYRRVMDEFGQFPGGGFGGDENCRKGYTDPRQGFETCGMVEFMHSFEMLTKISGNSHWSDRCEEIAFNSFPAALTPDGKGLHYLTCANQVQLDKNNHAPTVENSGTMFSYSPFEVYRCCQHNVSHGWPYYAEELWLASADRGLCASLYAPSVVKARVADGNHVVITEETDYPFSDLITFKIALAGPTQFLLHLRLPGWCSKPVVQVNGHAFHVKPAPTGYLVVDRKWNDADVITLRLPMQLKVRRWQKNHDAASIDYGPLSFSLKIGEKWTRYGKNEEWPEWEVFPTTPWNYGLALDAKNPANSLQVVRKPGPLPPNPFTADTNPIEVRAPARRIPGWQIDHLAIVGKLQDSPVNSGEPVETVTLIPMGAARLRISAFPVIGHNGASLEWKVQE